MTTAEPAWAARFYAKVDTNGPIPERRPELGPCHAWTAALDEKGYGRLYVEGRQLPAHRLALMMIGVVIPQGYEVDHLCRNPSCVNAEHLEPVTRQVNHLRGDHPNAIAARLNRCPRGHEFTTDNAYVKPNGYRRCRTCQALADRVRRARNRRAALS